MRRSQRILGILLLIAMPFLVPAAAQADKRVALIVGNSAYQHVPPLPNPASDAKAMTAMLEKAGFAVVNANDVGYDNFTRAIRQFEGTAVDADIAVVYYAGYALDIRGTNYIIPVDAKLADERDAPDEAIALDRLIDAMNGARRLRLLIVDACRDNPFSATAHQAGLQTVTRGLARIERQDSDTLIAYAAKAGSTSEDGNGPHSPLTTALLNNLTEPGLDVRLALGRVRDEVLKITDNRQEPFVYGSLGAQIISLVPAPSEPSEASQSAIKTDYQLVVKIGTQRAYEVFLSQYPTGFYSDLARAELAKLSAPKEGSNKTASPEFPTPSAPAQATSDAARMWDRIKDSEAQGALQDFINRYPDSPLAQNAKRRLDQLQQITKEKVAQQAQHVGMPDFPWPPPEASASYVMPQNLFGKRETVGEETELILSALESNGYVEHSFYGTPSGGVALITRLERINDDGTPAIARLRWPPGEYQRDATGLAQFLRGLFYADPGHYRIIVFIIQDEPFTQNPGKPMSAAEAQKLLPGGVDVLPHQFAERSVIDSHCTALIYEFANDGAAMRKIASHLTGRQHLEKAGLLAALKKPN